MLFSQLTHSHFLQIYFAEINIQIFINPCFDRISKGILSGITGIEIIDNYKVFLPDLQSSIHVPRQSDI